MKTIKILALTASVILVFWMGGFLALRIMDANERARIYLVNAISPLLNEELIIEKLDIKFGSVVLEGVRILQKEKSNSLYIGKVEISYSLPKLLIRGFEPRNVAESIVLRNPQFTFESREKAQGDTSLSTFFKNISLPQLFLAYGAIAKRLDFLNRIAVEDGKVIHGNLSASEEIASGISGWLMTGNKLYTEIGLQGRLFDSSKNNFSFSGLLDAEREDYRFWMQFEDFPLNHELVTFPGKDVQVKDGIFSGTFLVRYFGAGNRENRIDISGDFGITQGNIFLRKKAIEMTDVRIDGRVENDSLTLRSFHGTVDGIPIAASGRIANIFRPVLQFRLSAATVPIGYIREKLISEIPADASGSVTVEASAAGTVDSLFFDGILSGKELSIGNRRLSYVNVLYTLRGRTLDIREFTGSVDIFTVTGQGVLKLLPGYPLEGRIDVYSNLDFIREKAEFLAEVENRVRCAISFAGAAHDLEGKLEAVFGSERTRLDISGTFRLNDALSASGEGPNGIRWRIEGDSLNTGAGISIQIEEPLRLFAGIWHLPALNLLAENYRSSLSVERSEKDWILDSRAYRELRGAPPMEYYNIHSTIRESGNALALLAEIDYFPQKDKKYTALLDIVREDGKYFVRRFEIPSVMQGLLTYDPASLHKIDGWISFDTDVNNLYALFNRKPKFVKQGRLSGVVELERNESGLVYHGDVDLQNATLENTSGYHAFVKFRAPEPNILKIDEYEVEHPHNVYVWGNGQFDFARDSVNIIIKGDAINADTLIATLGGGSGTITGGLSADLQMVGSIGSPFFVGNASLTRGKIVGIRFDSISASLVGPSSDNLSRIGGPGKSYYPRGIWLENCVFRRNGQYQLSGGGYLPFNKTDDLDLPFAGDGNFLAILEDLSNGYFVRTGSSGVTSFRLAGPFDAITLGSLRLDLSGGLLQAESIIPEIGNIGVSAELPAETRFISIKKLSGEIGGTNVSVSNDVTVSISPAGDDSLLLPPLILTEDGLTWGVLAVSTDSKRGYRFAFPGIQETGDWGTYLLSGKRPGEKVYFAGPADHPRVRGKLVLRDARLTYPLLTSGGAPREPNTVERFLYRVNWDVQVQADKNVEYFRVEPSSIPAITDNIYIRMNVGSGGNGLFFDGSLDDESFLVRGNITSTRGQLEFLDFNFKIQFIEATFNEHSIYPEVSGRARTTIRDSTGVPREVYAIIYTTPPQSPEKTVSDEWEDLKVRLAMDQPMENIPGVEQTQEEVLQLLGYAPNTIMDRAPDVAGLKADNALLRPFFRPMERSLRRVFQLDQVDIRPNLARNVTKGLLLGNAPGYGVDNSGLGLFSSGYLVLGKYFWEDLFFSYTGQLASGYNRADQEILGFNHLFGVEYRISPGLMIHLEFDRQFNKFRNKEDTRFWIRRYFSLRN